MCLLDANTTQIYGFDVHMYIYVYINKYIYIYTLYVLYIHYTYTLSIHMHIKDIVL